MFAFGSRTGFELEGSVGDKRVTDECVSFSLAVSKVGLVGSEAPVFVSTVGHVVHRGILKSRLVIYFF